MDCIDVYFLVVICYSYARSYHWGELSEEYIDCLYYFLQLYVNLKLFKNKKLKNIITGE